MSSPSVVNRFFRHSAIYAVGNALNRVGAFVLLPLYAHYLTVGEYGGLELFYAVSAVVSSLLSVGIAHATLRFYFEYEQAQDRQEVVSTNLIASLMICGAGVVLIGSVVGPVAELAMGSRPSNLGLGLVLVTLVFELSSQVGLAYLRAREKSIFFVTVSLAKLVVQCIANVLLLSQFHAGVEGVLGGNLLAVVFGWVVVSAYTVRHCGLRFRWAKLKPVLRYSLPFLYVTVIASVSGNLDRFAVSRMLSLEALGVFALATKFAKLISDLLGEPFSRAYGAFRFTIMDRPDAGDIQAALMRYMAAALAVVSLALVYFTGDVVRWIATDAYAPAAALMPLLVVAASLHTLNYLLQTGILVNKSTGELVTITLARSAAMLVVAFPLIWGFGLQGACAIALCDAVVSVWLTNRISQRYFPVHYDGGRLMTVVALLAGFYAAGTVLPSAGGPAIAAKLVLLAVFMAALWRTQLSAAERQAVHARLRLLLATGRSRTT
ncbi:lipopolysaccharide biosynthesis protein [Ideonella sp. BN130291]|uniref:lipopolysaccharide biosynthesis protein n=1 Tax=Ideonella sp. BN130291 TaxID=3112940 RepID=UPI002E258B49|nr:lipopolysaccharide biosynthesis protein [Ideonella sp. BN130291]